MASRPLSYPFNLAPTWLSQIINPLYWMTSGTGQIGLINISGTASANPAAEADIIENVATYGRQLGRMSDVLQAVLQHLHANRWHGADLEAVQQYKQMSAKIAAVKAGCLAPTKENVDQLIAGINSLKATDQDEYQRIKNELREKLFTNEAKAPRSENRASSSAKGKKGRDSAR